jgi:hypothetical protein
MDYYDIMVIGKTGMGKSTTADKLFIANPSGHNYPGGQHSNGEMTMSDLSMWLSSSDDEGKRRLKGLMECRYSDNPHEEVNRMYTSVIESTKSCQLISNDLSKIRVLDVPGFFRDSDGGSEVSLEEIARGAATSGLAIMRDVLRIQATMQLQFKRIIYFLPVRGPLERSQKDLQMELEQMVHFFGKSIFDCMVLVATVTPDIYPHITPGVIPFSDSEYAKTRKNFQSTIGRVLPKDVVLPDDKPPIVFISMHDTCEDILKKVQDAPVIADGMKLEFHYKTCTRCGIKARILGEGEKKIKVACSVDQDFIPYEESLCHPMIVPKYWKITTFLGGCLHTLTGNKFAGKWPNFENEDDEICIECMQVPGTRGCRRINSKYNIKFGQYTGVVDHEWVVGEQGNDIDVWPLPNN